MKAQFARPAGAAAAEPSIGSSPGAPSAWHVLAIDEVQQRLSTHRRTGLASDEAVARLARDGKNLIDTKPSRSLLRMLSDQFADFMILVLIAAAAIAGAIGDLKDTVVIAVIVILNAAIGVAQEWRAERAMDALRKMAAAAATVIRDGRRQSVAASEIVPGELVLIEAGNVIPADLRVMEAHRLKVDEATLTGESATVEKHANALDRSELPLADRSNMLYKGTIVAAGRASGLAVATGMNSELGKVAAMLDVEEGVKTPLQRRLSIFGKRLTWVVVGICVIFFALGLARGEAPIHMLLTAISLAVAAIPEALPAVVTVALAMGAHKMAQRNALVRRLPAVETLGSVTYICTDKTGTLTRNEMTAEVLFAGGRCVREWGSIPAAEPWTSLLQALALNNDAYLDDSAHASGEPTEAALLLLAHRAGFDKKVLAAALPRVAELPFDSERKRMTTIHGVAGEFIAFIKGAPESVLTNCSHEFTSDGQVAFEPAQVAAEVERMATAGLRVLAVAMRRLSRLPAHDDMHGMEDNLIFLGLVGLIDPPRPEAMEAVALCKSAGITPVMITGDHPKTAAAIAHRLDIAAPTDAILTGSELARLGDAELARCVERIRVYARVDPAQKIRIVRALQECGEYVAMTGDGVNDAPALRHADIGVAMGKSGTDVAREASSLVLLDDNFATIVSAVREGRRIFDNICKFIRFAMTGNAGEIWTIFLAPFLGLPIPLLPIHILWVNLVTDGLPGLALAAEPAEKGLMQRPPRAPEQSIFADGMWQHIIWVGLFIGGVSLSAQAYAIHIGSQHWQTMVFTVLTLSQMGHVLAIRSSRDSLFQQGLCSNKPLLATVVLTSALQLATIYVSALNQLFNTQPLSAHELIVCLLLSSLTFVAVEIEKMLVRRRFIYQGGSR